MINVTYEEIKSLLSVKELLEPIRQVFIDYTSGKTIGSPVNLLHFPHEADTHIKVAAIEGYDYFSVKVVSMFPSNVDRDISPFSGAVFVFDGHTGFPVATLLDRGLITDLRTAVAGALITDHAASKSATTVAVIGTGIQAYHQIVALAQLRPINQVHIYGRDANKAMLLRDNFLKVLPHLYVVIETSVEDAVKSARIIITTTSSREPLVLGRWLVAGQHVTAVGSDDIYKSELDSSCFDVADTVFLDSLDLNQEYGEYARAFSSDPSLADKTVEFGQAFQDRRTAHLENKLSIAKLVGVGVQDLAAATLVMQKLNA